MSDNTTLIQSIVCHPTADKIWLPKAGTLSLTERFWPPDASEILPQLNAALGFPTYVLSYLPPTPDEEEKRLVYLLVPQGELPSDAVWLAEEEAEQSPRMTAVFDLLRERTTGLPPWMQRNWWPTAVSWLTKQLAADGQTITAIEPAKTWRLSTVLRVQTAAGHNVYFKASPTLPLFANEGRMAQTLSTLLPGSAPPILHVHPTKPWLLMPDLGDPIGSSASVAEFAAAHAHFARLQISSLAHVDALLAAGCVDRRTAVFVQQIDALLHDPNLPGWLGEEKWEQLKTAVPQLQERYAQLQEFNLPQTLVHGDLHLGNAFRQKGQPLFFDWTDACIAHPFFDLNYLQEMGDENEKAQAAKAAYLAEWTAYESAEQLEAAYRLAKPLCLLHHLITYQQMLGRLAEPLLLGVPNFLAGKIIVALERENL